MTTKTLNTPITIYNPTPIKVSSFSILNWNGDSAGNRVWGSGYVSASFDGVTYTQIAPFTNTMTTGGTWWTLTVNSETFYRYYRITISTALNTSIGNQAIAMEVVPNATYMKGGDIDYMHAVAAHYPSYWYIKY